MEASRLGPHMHYDDSDGSDGNGVVMMMTDDDAGSDGLLMIKLLSKL